MQAFLAVKRLYGSHGPFAADEAVRPCLLVHNVHERLDPGVHFVVGTLQLTAEWIQNQYPDSLRRVGLICIDDPVASTVQAGNTKLLLSRLSLRVQAGSVKRIFAHGDLKQARLFHCCHSMSLQHNLDAS